MIENFNKDTYESTKKIHNVLDDCLILKGVYKKKYLKNIEQAVNHYLDFLETHQDEIVLEYRDFLPLLFSYYNLSNVDELLERYLNYVDFHIRKNIYESMRVLNCESQYYLFKSQEGNALIESVFRVSDSAMKSRDLLDCIYQQLDPGHKDRVFIAALNTKELRGYFFINKKLHSYVTCPSRIKPVPEKGRQAHVIYMKSTQKRFEIISNYYFSDNKFTEYLDNYLSGKSVRMNFENFFSLEGLFTEKGNRPEEEGSEIKKIYESMSFTEKRLAKNKAVAACNALKKIVSDLTTLNTRIYSAIHDCLSRNKLTPDNFFEFLYLF